MGATAQAKPLPLLAEAKALHNLMADGHPKLRYHVSRGCAWRDAQTKRALVFSHVARGEWRPARDIEADGTEVDRHLNPYVVRKHLQGSYDVAFEFPSWTSLIVFDVDRHLPGRVPASESHPELVKLANEQRDETMAELWKALKLDEKEPVVLQTPSGGYHVYLPLCRLRGVEGERTWPAAWIRERVEHKLAEVGMRLQPGRLELFPAGTRLRLPCGRGMVLLDDDLQPVEGTSETRGQGRVRQVAPMVQAFCAAIEKARRPLSEWLERPEAEWTEEWGPWGDRKKKEEVSPTVKIMPSRHKEDVSEQSFGRSPDSEAGVLLYGAEFVARVQNLARGGLVDAGTRHDAVLKLIWYWKICQGFSTDEALDRLSEWLESHPHVSHLLPAKPRNFNRDSMREGAHYAKALDRRGGSSGASPWSVNVAPSLLAATDEVVLSRISIDVRDDAVAILRLLKGHADAQGHVPHPVSLSSRILQRLCGDRRIKVTENGVTRRRRRVLLALEQLVDLGVLALHTNFSAGNHGKLYTCWYQFGSGKLPQVQDDGTVVLAQREIEEGRLQVVANDAQSPSVRLEPNQRVIPRLLDNAATRPPWWIRMYLRRLFTPAEFLQGDATKLIPGPFRHRYPASAYRPRVPSLSLAAELPDKPPDKRGVPPPAPPELRADEPAPAPLPASLEALLAELSGPLREQARKTWQGWFQKEDTS